jgi:hypothetical protein
MKKFASGLIIGLAIAWFSWWLQHKQPALYWTATHTRFTPLATGDSEFSGMSLYSLRIVNNGNSPANDLNIEATLPQGNFVSANLQVPEKSAITAWSEVSRSAPQPMVNLRYQRLLPGDTIEIGALLKAATDTEPKVGVRSDTTIGIAQEVVEQRRRRWQDTISTVAAFLPALILTGLLLSLRSRSGQRFMESIMHPIARFIGPSMAWLTGEVHLSTTFKAKNLMHRGKWRAAVELLKQSEKASDHLLLARCYARLNMEEPTRKALEKWLFLTHKEELDEQTDFNTIRSHEFYSHLKQRLTDSLDDR